MLVRSPKTEHHEGKDVRQVPIFPELRSYLDQAWDEAPDHATHVISINRDDRANFRTRLTKIIRRAGLAPWPKLWQNLRSSRATELANEFPGHVAAAWLGHSTAIAQKHYWQVTDGDFDRAILADDSEKAARKTAQQVRVESGGESQGISPRMKNAEKTAVSRRFVGRSVGGEGLEPPTSTV